MAFPTSNVVFEGEWISSCRKSQGRYFGLALRQKSAMVIQCQFIRTSCMVQKTFSTTAIVTPLHSKLIHPNLDSTGN